MKYRKIKQRNIIDFQLIENDMDQFGYHFAVYHKISDSSPYVSSLYSYAHGDIDDILQDTILKNSTLDITVPNNFDKKKLVIRFDGQFIFVEYKNTTLISIGEVLLAQLYRHIPSSLSQILYNITIQY